MASPMEPPPSAATIHLVGAGPGDPDLLTLAAVKALQQADVVVTDRLVSPDILAHVQCGEVRMAKAKKGGESDEAQDELNQWCLDALREGKRVVRLKIGDPYVFGRGGEEVLWFRSHGFEPVVVPGICSALAAPLEAGIPLTHRDVSDTIIITTGRGRGGSVPDFPPYRPENTLVLLMAVGRLRTLCDTLVNDKGYPPLTPVCVVEKATCPGRKEARGDLSKIAAVVEEQGVKAPAVVIVGNTVGVLAQTPDS